MGFLSKLRQFLSPENSTRQTVKHSSENHTKRERNASIRKEWLTLNNPYFFGRAHISPDKRWVLGCCDSDGNGIGGYREKGYGRVLLLDYHEDRVVFELTNVARPVAAAIADSGRFIVQDACFGSSLQSELIAVNPDKTEEYRRHFKAIIFSLEISKCGRYAVVQTCNAPSEDGNILSVMDLQTRSILFSVTPSTGWASRYKFKVDADGLLVSVSCEHRGIGWFSYSPDGTFSDSCAYLKARLKKGDYSLKIQAARELLDSRGEEENARIVLKVVDTALSEGADARSDWGATAHRIRGEAFEILGEPANALSAYEIALELNPKIGVKRRLTALKKLLSPNGLQHDI
ncbi:TPA: hypothetical protein ACNVSH_002301 [Klebsiella aerogenes]|uniref:tetratricopeptide repeat protein n=1 Tax=Klebsiella aerogenes TaxID=548 RepID=UPI00049F47A5|nr:tetratricopeptide repeat protein [Klebsiella aerogenes]EKU4981785.1 tetratricopeptide repeat protein [Klebsiella aerogenes]KDF30715.1 hypothetical protein AE04_02836 [Klebsiella aerogenes MGH 78]KLE53503.1 hypothetical protein YA12_03930 [Klebsiella aerogenes]KZQ56415.1 hypothetical protein A3N61_16240 [Klebsiella aerogenes]HBV6024594.1 hypothetical protein [Klebsiella aerogenes]